MSSSYVLFFPAVSNKIHYPTLPQIECPYLSIDPSKDNIRIARKLCSTTYCILTKLKHTLLSVLPEDLPTKSLPLINKCLD